MECHDEIDMQAHAVTLEELRQNAEEHLAATFPEVFGPRNNAMENQRRDEIADRMWAEYCFEHDIDVVTENSGYVSHRRDDGA